MSFQIDDVVTQINAPHKFERKKVSKNVKCFVCNSLIWSGGCACSLCDVPAHKTCAVKARRENCPVLERELSEALSTPSGGEPSQKIKTPSNGALEIFLSDGTSKTITYSPDIILSSIIQQIRDEKELDGSYIVYDKAGKVISNVDQSLKKIKTAFPLFYTPVENSSKSGKKFGYPLGKKKRTPQDIKLLTSSPQGNSKTRSKSIILGHQPKKSKKGVLVKDIPESVEQRHGTMSITVLSVTDLANQSSAYKLLYFTLTHLDTNQRHRSKLLENTATPTWNQTIKFHMPVAFGQWNIKIWAIRKIDANAADILLGEADFILKNFNDGDSEVKTLLLKKEDHQNKKEKKAGKRVDYLQIENLQLRHELENEKRHRESLRVQLEETQRKMAQQYEAYSEEIKTIKLKMQEFTSNRMIQPEPHVVVVMQEEIDTLTKDLQEARSQLQSSKTREEELRKHYEEQIEFYKSQAEGSKIKIPKISIQWSYQDRKLKTGSGTLAISDDEPKRNEWTPSKRVKSSMQQQMEAIAGNQKNLYIKKHHEDDEGGSRNHTLPEIQGHIPSFDKRHHRHRHPMMSDKKKRIQDVYDFGEILGTGGSSVVREGIHKENGKRVAIKILDNYDNVEDASDEEEAFWAEIEIIRQLDHPCILNVYDFYEDSEHYYVVLELLAGNELFDQIIEKGSYDEPEAVAIVYQVLLALEHLASKHICHLDLKPENILFTDETHTRIKLIDFGEASSCKEHKLTGWVGTNNYMAPEMIKHLEYDCKVDMWSLGVVTYIMLCGSFAFDAEDEIELYQDIMEMRYEFRSPEWDPVSDDAKDFVSSLLTGPVERLTATEALKHRWITKNLHKSGFDPRCLL